MSLLRPDRPDILDDLPPEQDPANPESKQPSDTSQPPSPVDPSADKAKGSSTHDGPEVDARTRANRENAKKSTGPKTRAGSAISAKNAVKHALFAADITQYFRTDEELVHYQAFVGGIVKDLAPDGDCETALAHRAADILFRLEALRNAEFKVYGGGGLVKDTIEGWLEQSKHPLELTSLYDSRFQRAFSKTMEELRRVQQSRRDKELHELEQLKGIALAHIQQNTTFDPAKFGFVLSRDFVFNQAHLAHAKYLAKFCAGEGRVEKQLVDYVAKVPRKVA
jgi:hypothetical protein